MKKFKISIFGTICATLLFIGCGGSSSSGGGTTATQDTGTSSGTVSGSYYEGATVCYDTDGDGSCTGEASSVTSDASGNFTLSGTANYAIIAEIPVGAIVHTVLGDTGVAITSSTKTVFAIPQNAISQATTDGGKVVLSAITTRIYTYMQDNVGASLDTALTAVAGILGVNKTDLLKDFNSASLDADTKNALKSKIAVLLEKIQGKASISEVKTAVDTFVAAMALPENIDVVKAE